MEILMRHFFYITKRVWISYMSIVSLQIAQSHIWLENNSSSIVWHLWLAFIYMRFLQSKLDSSLFVKITSITIVYLLIYVHEIILTRRYNSEIHNLIQVLHQQFSLKYLKLLSFSTYEGYEFHNATYYQSVAALLQYLIITILDISYVVNKVC